MSMFSDAVTPSPDELQRAMSERTDEQLYAVLHTESFHYTADARTAARKEFQRRNLDAAILGHRIATEHEAKRRENPEEDVIKKVGGSPKGKEQGATLGCLFLVALVIGLGWYGYGWLNKQGWITHNHDTPVWITGNWMPGEYRVCGMQTETPPVGVAVSEQTRAELPRLFCGKQWEGEGILEFQLAMPDYTAATNAIWHGGDWSALARYFHVLPVSYNGRIDRPDTVFDSWRCQLRGNSLLSSAGLVCDALN